MNKFNRYIFNQWYALDLLLNARLGGAPTETISSRLGRNYHGTWMEKTVNWMAHLIAPGADPDNDHCSDASEKTPDQDKEGGIIK
jgi:hypothetical protein